MFHAGPRWICEIFSGGVCLNGMGTLCASELGVAGTHGRDLGAWILAGREGGAK